MPLPTATDVRAVLRPVHSDEAIAAALAEAGQLIADWAGPEYDGVDPLVATWRITGRRAPAAIHFPHHVVQVDQCTVDGRALSSSEYELDGYGLRSYLGAWYGVIQAVYHPTPDGALRYQVALDLVNLRLAWSPANSQSIIGVSFTVSAPDWDKQINRVLSRLPRGLAGQVLPNLITRQTAAALHTDTLYVGTLAAADATVDLSGLSAGLRIPAFADQRFIFVAAPTTRPLKRLSIGAAGLDILPTFVRRPAAATLAGIEYDAWVSGVAYDGAVVSGLPVVAVQ